MWPGVGMAWILVNVSPKISSQSAGWIAGVYSSVRSWRILRSSTQHSVMTRLTSRRAAAGAVSSASSGKPAYAATAGSAEAAGGTPGAADVTDVSPLAVFIERSAGVVAGHSLPGGPPPGPWLSPFPGPRGAGTDPRH